MKKIAVAALAGLLASCVSTEVLRVDERSRPPRRPEDVRVLLKEPPQPFTVIAVVHARSDLKDLESMKAEVLEKAAKLGGEAVVLQHRVNQRRRREWRSMSGKVLVFEPAPAAR